MRAILNLIFFILILCSGLAGGYLFAKTGYSVPVVGEKLDALVPASMSTGKTVDQLSQNLEEQTAIAQQLDRALQTARNEASALQAQNDQLVETLNNPVNTASTGSAASEALVNDLIEQNQFLTDELTAILTEKSDVEAQLQQLQANPVANSSESNGAIQQQVTQLLSERQQMVQSLTQALKDRDSADAEKRNLQAQLQSVLAQLQSSGADVGSVLRDSGIDLNALSQGQAGSVLQNIVNGLGN